MLRNCFRERVCAHVKSSTNAKGRAHVDVQFWGSLLRTPSYLTYGRHSRQFHEEFHNLRQLATAG